MYSLKVRGTVHKESKKSLSQKEKAGSPRSSYLPPSKQSSSDANAPTKGDEQDDDVDLLNFSAGNPRVEHITGVVHLYRHLLDDDEDAGFAVENKYFSSPPFSGLPPSRTEQLCVLSLPPDMGFPEFCTFLGAYLDRVKEIRLVRRDSAAKSTCLVLLRFDAQDGADGFYSDFNGKPFCILEPEICRLLYVKEVEVSESFNNSTTNKSTNNNSGGSDGKEETSSGQPVANTPNKSPTFASVAAGGGKQQQPQQKLSPPRPPPGVTELPSCPVCLERLDEHVSGIVTTVCNHKFHNQCLRQWGDTSCPVCRYCQHPAESTSNCASCGTSTDLWICLICGHVGCGRYRGSHAATHWQESGHGYALELESQRVWDYASDAYVHRLIRSKTDGKIVEVPAPGGSAAAGGSECGGGGGECSNGIHHNHHHSGAGGGGGGGMGMGLDPDIEEALVLSKLDVLAQEYNQLLVSQLDSQRHHYEGLLEKQQRELEAEIRAEKAKVEVAQAAAEVAEGVAVEAERRKQQLESKLVEVNSQLDTSKKETSFLKELNDTLLANQKDFAAKLKAAEASAAQQKAVIADLQDQLRDLMVFIEAQQIIAGSGEVAGGTVLPVPDPPQRRGGKKKK